MTKIALCLPADEETYNFMDVPYFQILVGDSKGGRVLIKVCNKNFEQASEELRY